jgi:hypothetical protein
MIRNHYNYKKNKTLTPILDVLGQHAYAVSMSYTLIVDLGAKGMMGAYCTSCPIHYKWHIRWIGSML